MKENSPESKRKTSLKRYRWEQMKLREITGVADHTDMILTQNDVRNLVRMILQKTDPPKQQ